jgi:hypothetical protein
MLMGSNPNTSAPRRTGEWSAELPIKPMMATSQVRMAIVFLQSRRSSRGGRAAARRANLSTDAVLIARRCRRFFYYLL